MKCKESQEIYVIKCKVLLISRHPDFRKIENCVSENGQNAAKHGLKKMHWICKSGHHWLPYQILMKLLRAELDGWELQQMGGVEVAMVCW